MPADPNLLIEAIRARLNTPSQRAGRGIGLASSYLKTFAGDGYGPYRGKDWDAQLRAAESKLVYGDNSTVVIGGSVPPSGQKESRPIFGKPLAKGVMDGTPGSIMDFEGILTSARKDRDGDELDPAGGEVDPRMPLLWQHLPEHPIGKMVQVVSQNELAIEIHAALADVPMARDAATLVEFGALRLSHGFQPIEFEPLDSKAAETGGWKVKRYTIMEASLVSVPSNTDSVVLAYSRQKLHCPLVKRWAGELFHARPAQVTSGWSPEAPADQVEVKIGLNAQVVNDAIVKGLRESLQAALGGQETKAPYPTGPMPTGPGRQPGVGSPGQVVPPPAGTPILPGQIGRPAAPAPGFVAPRPATPGAATRPPVAPRPPVQPGAQGGSSGRKDDDPTDPEAAAEEMPEATPEPEPAPGEDGGAILLSDLRALVDEAAGAADLSNEAKERLRVLSALVGDAEDAVKAAAATIKDTAKQQDLAGIFGGMDELLDSVVGMLGRIKDESGRIQASGAGAASDALTRLDQSIDFLSDLLGGVASSADPGALASPEDAGLPPGPPPMDALPDPGADDLDLIAQLMDEGGEGRPGKGLRPFAAAR